MFLSVNRTRPDEVHHGYIRVLHSLLWSSFLLVSISLNLSVAANCDKMLRKCPPFPFPKLRNSRTFSIFIFWLFSSYSVCQVQQAWTKYFSLKSQIDIAGTWRNKSFSLLKKAFFLTYNPRPLTPFSQ